jgi:hypothetical protein
MPYERVLSEGANMKPPGEVIALLWRLFVFNPEKQR